MRHQPNPYERSVTHPDAEEMEPDADDVMAPDQDEPAQDTPVKSTFGGTQFKVSMTCTRSEATVAPGAGEEGDQ